MLRFQRYQSLADAIPHIVFRTNVETEIEYLNLYWVTYTNQSSESSKGHFWKKALLKADVFELERKWSEAKKTGRCFEMQCQIYHHATTEFRRQLLKVVPEFGKKHQLLGWIGIATDIHDQMLVQYELIKAKKLAEIASETKSNFLANMSHEIRTPLGIILGFSELLVDQQTNEKEQADFMLTIRRNGEQLSKLIDEILDLSKVEAGKMTIEKGPVNVLDLLSSVHSSMSLRAKEKNLDLKVEIHEQVPKVVLTSASRLHQIMINLVGNAVKFTKHGEIKISVSYSDNIEKSVLQIGVKDSGPGLTKNQIEILFQPFTQVDTSMTRKHGGTGLGLSLSKKLARALKGDITIEESKPGEGCNFIVTIPVEVLPHSEFISQAHLSESKPDSKNSSVQKTLVLQGMNVLLVEDSLENQMVISRFLMSAGAQVEMAVNGVEGVQKALAGNHDLVLMDIQMPELDGYGAITQLRQQGYPKPIIALTAHGMVEDRQKSMEVGSNFHLTKPVNRTVLIEKIQSYKNSEKFN